MEPAKNAKVHEKAFPVFLVPRFLESIGRFLVFGIFEVIGDKNSNLAHSGRPPKTLIESWSENPPPDAIGGNPIFIHKDTKRLSGFRGRIF
jgi:hypothetical protein